MNAKNLASEIYNKSKLQNYAGLKQLLSGDTRTVLTNLNNDPGFLLVKELADKYSKEVAPKYDEINLTITALQRTYMKAQLELNTESRIFPDANSTLRVTYGKVKGYEPKDATVYTPITYLDGVMEKYIPGDENSNHAIVNSRDVRATGTPLSSRRRDSRSSRKPPSSIERRAVFGR